MKLEPSDEEARSRSDASSHDAGDVADTEMDTGPGAENTRQVGERRGDSGPLPPPQPPPAKKKRTRTLTTPHQSAVLHALLAQSRFPTTAMREEVGRSIGLSARKVQVWFQNQRQKARRPRNQGSSPPMRPPQYGAYPNAPAPSSAASIVGHSSFLPSEEQAPFYTATPAPFVRFNKNREHSSHEDVFGPAVTGTSSSAGGHLSGPGVPGVSSSFAPRFLPPIPPPSHSGHTPQQRSPSSGHGSARHLAPSRDFTFNFPFPPLQVPEVSGAPHPGQKWFPHPHRMTASLPDLGEPRSQQISFAYDSRPHTPRSFLVPQGRLEPARDLPRLHIPPLHVPESPHVQRRSSLPYSPPQDPVRAVLSATSGSSHGGSPSAPSRARRFDPVREAASERSASQSTDMSTPPRIDTPHV